MLARAEQVTHISEPVCCSTSLSAQQHKRKWLYASYTSANLRQPNINHTYHVTNHTTKAVLYPGNSPAHVSAKNKNMCCSTFSVTSWQSILHKRTDSALTTLSIRAAYAAC